MILCVDIGNTNTKVGAFDGDALLFVFEFATDGRATGEQIEILLRHGLDKYSDDCEISGAIVSSVVPQATRAMVGAIEGVCGVDAELVPLDKGVGADIYCSVSYVRERVELPAVVFSLGTATTMVVVGEKGEIIGGLICAGAMTGLEALAEKTSSLPMVAAEVPKDGFLAMTTEGAMQSGLVYGTAEMIDGLAERVVRENGVKTLVMSGGMSRLIGGHVRNEFITVKDIVLKGARVLYGKEKS